LVVPADFRFVPEVHFAVSAPPDSVPDDRCAPAEERLAPAARCPAEPVADGHSALPDLLRADWAARMAGDRCAPAEEPVAPAARCRAEPVADGHSALPDLLRAGWAGRMADDRCAPAEELVAPAARCRAEPVADGHSALPDLLLADWAAPTAVDHCVPVVQRRLAAPADYSRQADLPVRVAMHPDAHSPRAVLADWWAGLPLE
jgi:hypothetical protein